MASHIVRIIDGQPFINADLFAGTLRYIAAREAAATRPDGEEAVCQWANDVADLLDDTVKAVTKPKKDKP